MLPMLIRSYRATWRRPTGFGQSVQALAGNARAAADTGGRPAEQIHARLSAGAAHTQ
jgi:hypothetical protein